MKRPRYRAESVQELFELLAAKFGVRVAVEMLARGGFDAEQLAGLGVSVEHLNRLLKDRVFALPRGVHYPRVN